jgi:hypothetical protein
MRGGWFAGGVYERAAVGGLRASRLPPHTVRGLVVYLGMCVCVHVLYIYIYIYIYICIYICIYIYSPTGQ